MLNECREPLSPLTRGEGFSAPFVSPSPHRRELDSHRFERRRVNDRLVAVLFEKDPPLVQLSVHLEHSQTRVDEP